MATKRWGGAQDEDGSAYLAYSSESNMVMHIARLQPDYLAPEPSYQRVRAAVPKAMMMGMADHVLRT